MSRNRPAPVLEGSDYSFFEHFRGSDGVASHGIDLKRLLADLHFSSAAEMGLELVDIVVNATRRALAGNLGEIGWRAIPSLMVHRSEPYIKFIALGEGIDPIRRPAYAQIVRQSFSTGGKLMLAPRFSRAVRSQATERVS